MTSANYISVACAAALIGGLLLPKAAFHSLDRGLLVWLVVCIALGVILSSIQPRRVGKGIKRSMLVSMVVLLGMVGFYSVRWLASRIIDIDAPRILIPFGSGASIDILDPALLPYLLALGAVFWLGTSFATAVATLSGSLLIAGALSLYAFGPEGIDRIQKIVVALSALCAALLSLWVVFG